MNYEKFKDLPEEICKKIFLYINFSVPGAVAIKTAEIREVKNCELFSNSPPKGTITLIDSDDELLDEFNDLDDEWNEYEYTEQYWEGFYAAHGIYPDGFV